MSTFEETNEIVVVIIKSIHISMSSRYLNEVISAIFTDLWPVIKFFFEKFYNNEKVVEDLCQLMKHFIRGMGSNFLPFIDQYFSFIINGYSAIPICSYLYSFEIVVTTYTNELSIRDKIKNTLDLLCKQTLVYLPDLSKFYILINYIGSFENNTELSEDFFGLIERISRINPVVIVGSELFETLVCITINCLSIEHIDTSKNITYFLNKIVNVRKLAKNKEITDEDKILIFNVSFNLKNNYRK